ncbi:uncharacterized protein LOC100846255 [Brachypodium distachyon]|uniref:PGG domain-containing protein n=1 Tax=Brachypodium distachyon TaxID=15368 RepID=I1IHE2_BRADI|nr:uncharacterized protein LOC100846255 [Brachypodium distachyon]KQJ86262.2 hypothetical protein BRADI_4g04340v3 [Brachypodium distachyon]|eukprot:XP_014757735.1 uncharacterized protein LOC100846255 [Brachypodium distachyon]
MEIVPDNTPDDDKSQNERRYMREVAGRILLLSTLVATVTYTAGFNPPGGVWQDNAGHLPGDPIIRSTQYVRYQVFFYCNATAFASSLTVFILLLLGEFVRRLKNLNGRPVNILGYYKIIVIPLVLVMLVGLFSLIGAYAAGTFRDTFTAVYTWLLVAAVFIYIAINRVRRPLPDCDYRDLQVLKGMHLRSVLMLLATFALSVTYVGGLSTPGGFWDSTEGGHRPGDTILKGARLTVFFVCNTTAFVASLLIVLVLVVTKIRRTMATFGASVVMLFGLLGSYLAGSSRGTHTTVYLTCLIVAILAFQVVVVRIIKVYMRRWPWNPVLHTQDARYEEDGREERASSNFVQLLSTLALTITYQAGLDPPGGLWQDNGDGHKAGDPILRTTNNRRYNAFFYCNSVAFAASLVCIILVQIRPLLKHRALEQAMILDLLGLVGAYAIGSCRDETSTVYAMGIGGAALVYVVIHVVLLDKANDHHCRKEEDARLLDRMGYGLFIFAILVATITYQAGLTPPGGFLLKDDESGHHAGDPVLLYNYPRRYRVFFYCNSASFMTSIALIILLVNHNIYRPAIRTHALSVCTAVTFFCLLSAFAAGTTQHLKTSIYILVLLALVVVVAVILLLAFFLRSLMYRVPALQIALARLADDATPAPAPALEMAPYEEAQDERKMQAKRLYHMTLGILVASVTYQAGLDPPGGSWQRSTDGHDAGDPVMHDNRRQRYLTFFYSNSISFLSSVFLMVLLLLTWMTKIPIKSWYSMVMQTMIVMNFLGLLGAYAAGSGREGKTAVYVVAIVLSVLVYFTIHVIVSLLRRKGPGDVSMPTDMAAQEQKPS